MSMKKKLLVMTLAAIFATPSLYAAYVVDTNANTGTSDDADDVQTVNIMVPEIALLDITNTVSDGTLSITIPETAVTDAGTGFGIYNATETVTYAISSNVDSASGATTTARTLGVSMTGDLPAGAKLTIISTGAGTAKGDTITHASAPTALQTSGTAVASTTLVSDIKNSILTDGVLTYALEPIESGGMMSFTGTDGTTADPITLTYTLSTDT